MWTPRDAAHGPSTATTAAGGDAEHTCDECSRSFADMDAFIDHMLTRRLDDDGPATKRLASARRRRAERPAHKCHQCPKSLCSRSNLRRHVAMMHGGGGVRKTSGCSDYVSPKRFSLPVDHHHLTDDHHTRPPSHVVTAANHLQRGAALCLPPFDDGDPRCNDDDSERHRVHLTLGHNGCCNEKKLKCLVCYNTFSRRRSLACHIMNYHLQAIATSRRREVIASTMTEANKSNGDTIVRM